MEIVLLPNPDRKKEMTVVIDGDPWRKIHISIFGFKPALPKKCDSLEQLIEQFALLEYRGAKNYVIRQLARMSLPSSRLTHFLKLRYVSEPIIARVIDELSEIGYINDPEWVASFVRLQSAKGAGPRLISQKLASKGISSSLRDAHLEESKTEESQKIRICKLLSTRYRTRNLADFQERKKVVASLARRGFEFPLILECIGQDNDLDDEFEMH